MQSTLHVAVIMDGNGRWALQRGLPRLAGHRAGAETLRTVVREAPALGIATLTAYAFSADNWKRPAEEVLGLMTLLAWYLGEEAPRLRAEGVRLSVVGRRDRLSPDLLDVIERAESATGPGTRMHLRLAVDYSSRDAILKASRHSGEAPRVIDELPGLCEPVDLLIRTGGEQRLSDFLLWECAYAELFFTRRMWPEFGANDLRDALREYRRRNRRFGGVPALEPAPPVHERWLR